MKTSDELFGEFHSLYGAYEEKMEHISHAHQQGILARETFIKALNNSMGDLYMEIRQWFLALSYEDQVTVVYMCADSQAMNNSLYGVVMEIHPSLAAIIG